MKKKVNLLFLLYFSILNSYFIQNKKNKFFIGLTFIFTSYFSFKEIKKRLDVNDTSIEKFNKILKKNPKNISIEYCYFYKGILKILNEFTFENLDKNVLNEIFNDFYNDASKGLFDKEKKFNEISPFLKKYFKFLEKNKFSISYLKINEVEELIYLDKKDKNEEIKKDNFLLQVLPCYFNFNNQKKIKKNDFKMDEEYYENRIESIRKSKFLFGYFYEDNYNYELLNIFDKKILKFAIKDILKEAEEKTVNEIFKFLLSVQKKRNNDYLKKFKETYGKDFKNNSYDNFYNFFLKRRNLKIFAFSVILFLLRNKIKSFTDYEIKSPIDIFLKNSISSEKFFENKTGKLILVSIFAGFLINKCDIFSKLKIKNLITIVSGTFI